MLQLKLIGQQSIRSFFSQEGVMVEHKRSLVQSSGKGFFLLKYYLSLCKSFFPSLQTLCSYAKTRMYYSVNGLCSGK